MAIIKVKTGGITADAITDALIADDVVGTEHLTANEVDTTALKGDAVTGAELADNAVNSEHYTDGSVDTAHIADAQITTAKLSTAVFTGATDIGAAIVDADLFLMDDGAGGTIRKTTASRIKTYAGGSNEPYFEAVLGTTAVTLSSGSATKIPFNVLKVAEPSGTFDNSTNYRFTPGVVGKYMVSLFASISADANNAQMATLLHVSKNGTIEHYVSGTNNRDEGQGRGHLSGGTCMVDLDANDYIEAFATNTSESSANGRIDGESTQTFFSAFKLIDA